MARVSIYVPDTMKTRMDAFPDVNWSGIAQTAFAIDLARQSNSGEMTMDAVVERLRASKVAYEEAEKGRGAKEGKEWATKHADYVDLRKMASINIGEAHNSYAEYVNSIFGIEEMNEEAWFFDVESREWESDEYVDAFVDAAADVWKAVRSQL